MTSNSLETEDNPTNKKLPKLAGKHRKSNATTCEHADKEFLESQINTLKSVVARREAELKKVQESDNLKAKRIMQLEAQLSEARDAVCLLNSNGSEKIPDVPELSDKGKQNENHLLSNLANKTTNLENQMTILLSKFDNLQQDLKKDAQEEVPTNSSKTQKCYSVTFVNQISTTKMT